MTISKVAAGNVAPTTNVSTVTITVPTVQDGDWILIFTGAPATASGAVSTTNTGTVGGGAAMTQIGTLQNTTGISTTAWKHKLLATDSTKTIIYVYGGSTVESLAWYIMRGLDGTDCVDAYNANVAAGASSTSATGPSLTTVAANCVELSAEYGQGTAGTGFNAWTAPSPLTLETTAAESNAALACSVLAIASNLTPVSAGSTLGPRTWTKNVASSTQSGWILSLRPPTSNAAPTVTTAATQDITAGTVSLSASFGDDVAVTAAQWSKGGTNLTTSTSGLNTASGTATATDTAPAGTTVYTCTVTDGGGLTATATCTVYASPAVGTDVTVASYTGASYTLLGTAASILAAINDTDATTGAQSPNAPAGATQVLVWNPHGDGPIVHYLSGYQSPSSPQITRQVTTYLTDGTTQVYQTSYALPAGNTEQPITIDAPGLAIANTRAVRRSLKTVIVDTSA